MGQKEQEKNGFPFFFFKDTKGLPLYYPFKMGNESLVTH